MTPLELGIFAGYVALEWWLGRTKKVEANSVVDALLQGARIFLKLRGKE